MRKRWFVAAGIVALLALVYVFTATPQSAVTVSNARAMPMGSMFMVTLDLQNDGAPVALQSVSSPSGAGVSVMNPGHDGPIVIPGGDSAQLAMDGAHVMLQIPPDAFAEGTFHALALGFDDGSEVVARVLHPEPSGGMGAMNHGMAQGIEVSPSPAIALAQDVKASADGFALDISVQNFAFTRVEDSAPHIDGQGHAHVYLNGTKLGRLYEDRFEVGALLPGDYVLTIALNTNDHRPYLSEGKPIVLTIPFTL